MVLDLGTSYVLKSPLNVIQDRKTPLNTNEAIVNESHDLYTIDIHMCRLPVTQARGILPEKTLTYNDSLGRNYNDTQRIRI